MVEAVSALHCPPERQVAGQEHVGSVERDEQEAVRRPWSDPRNAVRAATTSSSDMPDKASSLRRPSTKRCATARKVAALRVDMPLDRTASGSAASISA